MGALIYKIGSFKMRSWEINSKINIVYIKRGFQKIKLQIKGESILRITPYRAFTSIEDLTLNFLRFNIKPQRRYFCSLIHTTSYSDEDIYFSKPNPTKKEVLVYDIRLLTYEEFLDCLDSKRTHILSNLELDLLSNTPENERKNMFKFGVTYFTVQGIRFRLLFIEKK
jgi:hypothetical protein